MTIAKGDDRNAATLYSIGLDSLGSRLNSVAKAVQLFDDKIETSCPYIDELSQRDGTIEDVAELMFLAGQLREHCDMLARRAERLTRDILEEIV